MPFLVPGSENSGHSTNLYQLFNGRLLGTTACVFSSFFIPLKVNILSDRKISSSCETYRRRIHSTRVVEYGLFMRSGDRS